MIKRHERKPGMAKSQEALCDEKQRERERKREVGGQPGYLEAILSQRDRKDGKTPSEQV